ncbi:MAG: MBL fold metallo-hydrolase [Bacteroidota bacterium]
MTQVAAFTFNPFQENTYLIYDNSKECIIIDPGCYQVEEKATIIDFIQKNELKPVRLINTHCHIDHVFGNRFISDAYDLDLEIHEGELVVLNTVTQVAKMYGIPYPEPSPLPKRYIQAGEIIGFGNTQLQTLFTPGHSPASISFYCEAAKFVVSGDVLFKSSIGRTDLPGGDFNTLINSIKTQLFPIGDEVKVYSGHGEPTTIGIERKTNPFLV